MYSGLNKNNNIKMKKKEASIKITTKLMKLQKQQ